MRNALFILLVSFFSLYGFSLRAQESNSNLSGSVKGIIRDTTRNFVLKSATVSVFKLADSSLISYQVSNNYGEFNFKNLPLEEALRLEISHVGYQLLRKKFSIPKDKNFLDLKTLIVSARDITLKEVNITLPPISMNGDTLEINASAFKLDTNAVVEDLLRKIPNVTLWGDGQITVNGREVKNLLVNGKEFFGGDKKIAIQNIAKNALDKIQVYNTADNKNNPLDSILTVNLKLKKGKEIGHFGKISAGYGTDKRYEADVSFNAFTPKMQLSIVGASNNINKWLNSINTLTANSTFKGVGTKVEYQPDFRRMGVNRPSASGVAFTYNFEEKPTWEKKSTLNANYFMQNEELDYVQDALTTTSLSDTGKVFGRSSYKRVSHNFNQRFDSNYEWDKKNNHLTITQAFTTNAGNRNNESLSEARNTQNVLTSTNNILSSNEYNNSNFNFQADYRLSENNMKPEQVFKGLNATYTLTVNNSEDNRSNLTDFKSFIDSVSNRNFNRKYETKTNSINQQLDLELINLRSLFFGKNQLGGINFTLKNELNIANTKDNNRVQDLNTVNNSYENNTYLTNKDNTDYVDETIALTISKRFNKSLSNRYSKDLLINISPKQKFIFQNNQSERAIRDIKRNYKQFLPDAYISYTNNQFGEYSRNYSLNFNNTLLIPTINQLEPLVDSSNLYGVYRGNVKLKVGIERRFSFNFNHNDQTSKNTLNYDFNITAGMVEDNIIDSTFIDNLNRRSIYLTNADGNKYINFRGEIKKAFKFKASELQVNLNTNLSSVKNPEYINDAFTFTNSFNTNTSLGLNYTYKDYLALAFTQSYGTYKSKQEAFNTQFTGANLATAVSSSYNITKKFTLNSNISFNQSSSPNAADVNFTIWNASAVYRFLKGNNAEFKFSALDILHQNTNIVNYGSSNSFTLGTQNVLQQYFMVTFSYYPRQFGKKEAKK